MEITVAGTAQVFHLIPFYAMAEHQGITKSGAKLHIILKTTIICVAYFFLFHSFSFFFQVCICHEKQKKQ